MLTHRVYTCMLKTQWMKEALGTSQAHKTKTSMKEEQILLRMEMGEGSMWDFHKSKSQHVASSALQFG